jgi:hypothetical protein
VLGDFIEEEHAVVSQRDLARTRRAATTSATAEAVWCGAR